MTTAAKLALGFVACLIASEPLIGQCPDGSPPPCDSRRAAPLRVIPQAPPPAADRARRFLILPFRNVSRQADQDWLVEGSTTMLVDALGRWQGITVVPDEKLYPALKRAGIAPGTIADPARVRRIAEETGGWTAVTGEMLATGGKLRITARASDVATGRELVRASSEVSSGGDVRVAFDSLSLRLLQSAGFDAATTNLASATTHNLDAYRSYLSGLAHVRRSEIKPALKDFQNAVRQDSGFAMGWYRLAEMTLSTEPGALMNPGSNSAKYSAKAVSLSAQLPARQRQLVLANDAIFKAHFGDARRILEGLIAADSNDFDAAGVLVGVEMVDPVLVDVPGGKRPRGSPNRAARLAKRTAQLDPSRHAMFGTLASIYASAGVPGSQPALGVDREPTSFPDFIQLVRQREHRRSYTMVLRDSLELVPAESLSAIPKDSMRAMQKRARASAKQWADQWLNVASDEAAPYVVASQLHGYDREYPEALTALAKAESLGVQIPTFSAPAKRMVLLARSGSIAAASRIADSLTVAGYFANPNILIVNEDVAMWAFALNLANGKGARAGTLLDQQQALYRMLGVPIAELGSFQSLMGNDDPEEEPGIGRSFRRTELDSVIAHVVELAAVPQVGPWLPSLLPSLADNADTTKRLVPSLVKVAETLAAAGKENLAFELASNAASDDSTLEPAIAQFPWYRQRAEAFNAVKSTTAARFRAGSGTVAADRAVFEWIVADSAPFALNRAETPAGRPEYRWEVTVDVAGRYYRMVAAVPPRTPTVAPRMATLSEVLGPASQSYVATGVLTAGVQRDTTTMQGVAVRAEAAPGVLRMIVTDKTMLDALRSARPATARFRFWPCVRPLGSMAPLVCNDGTAAITYR